jgi:hypothetical protein
MQVSSMKYMTLTNELGASGKFIELARNGQLIVVSEAICDRSRVVKELTEVERQLIACNDNQSLAELAIWCVHKGRNFESRLRKLAAGLEAQKCRLLTELRTIDHQLAQEHPGVEWTAELAPISSLVPRLTRKTDPYVAERNEVIDEHLDLPNQQICKLLDQNFARGSRGCCDHLPRTWALTNKVHTFTGAYRHPQCRKLVHKMISVRRHLCSYP